MRKSLAVLSMVVGWCLLTAAPALSQASGNADLEDTLQYILQQLKDQQEQISTQSRQLNTLSQQVQDQNAVIEDQTKLIESQRQIIDQQNEKLSQQIADFERQKTEFESTADELRAVPAQSDSYGAKLAYEVAWDIYDTAIFEVRRRDQGPYFERAAQRFKEVVENYPLSDKADDAQYRVALIYHRYLDNPTRAAEEWRFLLKQFPTSKYAAKAREALRDLGVQ